MSVALLVLGIASPVKAAEPTGEQIFAQHCARCHGDAGQGAKRHPEPLIGDKSVNELAAVIDKTMPEDDPDKLDAAGSKRVAAYIHETFYSPAAQARNRPARIDLSRLTVRQYRNTVSDLVGSFRQPVRTDDRHGLQAEYFKSRRFRTDDRVLDRIDPAVKFDFGTKSPMPGKLEDSDFSIRWEGSVLAPDTGDYEFVIRTEHATRLWLNDSERPLIDAWVKSGNDTEYRASIFLIAGRSYSLKLEFSKATQGVARRVKEKPAVPASIQLLWKRPHRVEEVIPERHLSPGRSPEVFVVTTPFPPDDRSLGWVRGTAISKSWATATTDAAIETAGYVVEHLDELAGVQVARRERRRSESGDPASINFDGPGKKAVDPARTTKLRDFCAKFVERAFRRPLTDDQRLLYIDRQFEGVSDPEVAVRRVVLLALKSPRFLYRDLGEPDGYAVASRLSYALWDSLPDQELLRAAAGGKLATRDQVTRQAERMLNDPRARSKLLEFLSVWLKTDHNPDLTKDAERYPGFDPAIASDLRSSLELLLAEVLDAEKPDFRKLLLADDLYLNGRLAKYYGVDLPPDATFRKVKLNAEKRSGVLTHPYIMAAFAYTSSTSPIHRGVFLARGVLGRSLKQPPEAFAPLAENLHPNLTTRERVTLQTKPQACASCHEMINPLGFTLEHFDAVGRYREEENGQPIDTSGVYLTSTGEAVKLDGARQLGKYLADSTEVQAAFAEQVFHHLAQQPVLAYGPKRLDELCDAFRRSGFDINRLAIDAAVTAAMTGRAQ